jgi:D-serine deaminase-like pyridoxal phosphate-dependent protein
MPEWDIERIDTPAVLVDLDVVEANLIRVQARAQARGLALWPHTKTHKSTWLAAKQLDLGAQGLTVAKLGEAEVMRAAGLHTLLIAYPLIGPIKLERMTHLLEHGATVRVALDSREAADTVAEAARRAGTEVGVLIEIDTEYHRVGVPPGEAALPLARYVADQHGPRYQGLFSFAGHMSGNLDEEGRRRILEREATILAQTRDILVRAGLAPEAISLGGTHHSARMEQLGLGTEIRPGTYIYNDRNTVIAGSCDEADCAASVLVTVVSAHETWAVIDGGSKTFTFDQSHLGGFGIVRGWPEIVFERMSEEHGILTWSGRTPLLRVGERLQIIPNHICPVINLHDASYGVRRGQVERIIRTDGRGKVQ